MRAAASSRRNYIAFSRRLKTRGGEKHGGFWGGTGGGHDFDVEIAVIVECLPREEVAHYGVAMLPDRLLQFTL